MVSAVPHWSRWVLMTLVWSGPLASCVLAQTTESGPDSLVSAYVDLVDEQALADALDSPPSDRPGLVRWSSTITRSNGDAPRMRTRLDLDVSNVVARFDAEQDPCEPWSWRPAAGRWGFDHVGAYTTWHPSSHWMILLGDYRLAQGLGLVTSPPRLGRAVDDAFGASHTGRIVAGTGPVRPYAGSDEDRYYSGIAVVGVWKRLRITVFRSRRHLDATSDSVRLEDGSWQSGMLLRPAQDHATALGAGRRRGLRLATTGGVAGFSVTGFDVSTLVSHEVTNPSLVANSRLADHPFSRRWIGSVSARANRGRVSWSGEAGLVDGFVSAATYLRVRDQAVSFLLGWRRYAPEYAPLWASAPSFRSGAPGNEKGYTAAVQWRPDRGGPFRLSFDRGCRISVEADYARTGCRESTRVDARWDVGEWRVDGVASRDRSRDPDTAVGRGLDSQRSIVSIVAAHQANPALTLTISATFRHVRVTPRAGGSEVDLRTPWSSKVAVRARWQVTPRLVAHAGLADFHVTESVLGLYRPGLPLMPQMGTLTGGGTDAFVTAIRTGLRMDWGATLRHTRSGPARPEPRSAVKSSLGMGIYVRLTSARPLSRT